ncbi:MAG TPA: hypothetical protein PK442_02595, partial [Synergistales bacterium]|nr:hypothetical protein [Synergistales bacterium]
MITKQFSRPDKDFVFFFPFEFSSCKIFIQRRPYERDFLENRFASLDLTVRGIVITRSPVTRFLFVRE